MNAPTFTLQIGDESPISIPNWMAHLPRVGETLYVPEITEDVLIIREISHEIRSNPSAHRIICYVDRQ